MGILLLVAGGRWLAVSNSLIFTLEFNNDLSMLPLSQANVNSLFLWCLLWNRARLWEVPLERWMCPVTCFMGKEERQGDWTLGLHPNVKEQTSCKREQRNRLSFSTCGGLLGKVGYSLIVNPDHPLPTSPWESPNLKTVKAANESPHVSSCFSSLADGPHKDVSTAWGRHSAAAPLGSAEPTVSWPQCHFKLTVTWRYGVLIRGLSSLISSVDWTKLF